MDLTGIATEARNPATMELDTMTPLEIAEAMSREDERAVMAVRAVLPRVARAIEWAGEALCAGGRVIYVGAGTSGRLGVLDAVECPPTFGVSPDVVIGLIAGGEGAFVKAVEGAEDSPELGARDVESVAAGEKDLVVGLAASGRTPYVVGALRHAREAGCRTVAVACSGESPIGAVADLAIEVATGPEVVTGSTRLKAGTAQKTILNMISTGAMVSCGKVYQNLMVDVQLTNEKLVARARSIVRSATGCSEETAGAALCKAEGNAKTAIVMVEKECDASEAQELLARAGGSVRRALGRSQRAGGRPDPTE